MPYPRVSGRKGATIRLNADFFANGILTDPYAITRIDIYKQSKATENLVAQIEIGDPDSSGYPTPLVQTATGRYYLDWEVPDDLEAPAVYLDDWQFIGDELVASSGSSVDLDDETLWDSQCNTFWLVTASNWYVDDQLYTYDFGFDPLDRNITKPERRSIEVGIMPLPLYDFDYNRVAPLMAHLVATISVYTMNHELLVDDASAIIGLRHGAHRANPFVVRYLVDSSLALYRKGTYKYFVSLALPNGETRNSPYFTFSIN